MWWELDNYSVNKVSSFTLQTKSEETIKHNLFFQISLNVLVLFSNFL